MGINTTENIFESAKYHKFKIITGKPNGTSTCKICGKKVSKGKYAVAVHTFGEYPSYFHKECAEKIGELLHRGANRIRWMEDVAKKKDAEPTK